LLLTFRRPGKSILFLPHPLQASKQKQTMKHSFLRSAVAIATLSTMTFLGACSDDDVTPEEIISHNPLNEYLAGVELTVDTKDYGTLYSLGYEFNPKFDGTITELGCAVPVAGKYIIELYDSESQELLAKDSVEFSAEDVAADAFAWKYAELTSAVNVTANKNYRVVYSTNEEANAFYRIDPQDGFVLPILNEDSSIEITQGVYGDPESFPNEPWNEVVYLADVKFDYKKQ
jgi:hypothetical protein